MLAAVRNEVVDEMRHSIYKALVALMTFAIGLGAVAFWHGYYQRARTWRLSAGSVATVSPVPPAGIRITAPPPQMRHEPPVNTAPQRSEYLRAIRFTRGDEYSRQAQLILDNTASEELDVDLELGDIISNQLIEWDDKTENQRIILSPTNAAKAREFKIEQQFETSFQVSSEGPHVDLRDWKHYYSHWRELKRMGDTMFLTRKISEAEAQRFPTVTRQEIYSAVLKAGDPAWASDARTCRTLTSAPCGVGVSTISFRISVREKGRWKIINRINFAIPMGC